MVLEKPVAIDKNKADINGATPLHVAAWNNHAEIVEILLRAGAGIPEDLREFCSIKKVALKAFCMGLHQEMWDESPVQLLQGFSQIMESICTDDYDRLP